jgi:hypothetical protein
MPENRKMIGVSEKDYEAIANPLPRRRGATVIDWRKRFKYIHLNGKDWISAEEVMQYIRDLEAAVPTEDNATDQSHPTIFGSSVN